MRSGSRLLIALIFLFQTAGARPALAQAPNVLPPIRAPHAAASPPSTLLHARTAAVPRGYRLYRPHVLPLARAPRAIASPPSSRRRLIGRGYARGYRASRAAHVNAIAVAASATTLLSEPFTGAATTANAWLAGGDACITAGSAQSTPASSVPACGSNAAQDPTGSGALQLTVPASSQTGYVFSNTSLPLSSGLSISFDYYSFGSTGTPGDGIALVLADASKPFPANIGGCCGSLGYAPYFSTPGLSDGYLGIGFDEVGYWSAADDGVSGGLGSLLANTITVRGAGSLGAPYLFSAENSSGQAASLPLSLYTANATARPTPLTVNATLTAGGLLSVSIDQHNGAGPIAYIPPTQVAGVNGQPGLPSNVYLALISSGGGTNARHQIDNVSVTTAPAQTGVTSEAFTGAATTPNAWEYGDDACLTAGTAATPATSVPACGANAPQDAVGSGALQLTPPVAANDGYVFDTLPVATSSGVTVSFNEYSFDSLGAPVGDGVAVIFTDASKPLPTAIGGCCGSLGYAQHFYSATLANGYLGIGLDESGYYSAANENKNGGLAALLPNTISIRGLASSGAPYLFSSENTAGQAAALPFALTAPSATSRPAGITVTATLTATGRVSVAIDRHDGNGPVTYIAPTAVVGLNGQPAVPASLYVGFIAAGGGADSRHQISNVSITAATAAPAPTPTPTAPPTPVPTATPTAPPATKASVVTYHNDSNRTGWNPNETVLTTSNVKASTFGLLHTVAVDGRVDAQPLVVPNVSIAGLGVHDVVYVATENDSIYAIDAESGVILGSRNLATSIPYTNKDDDDNVYPTFGILSTPVIDTANNAIYVVTDGNEGASAPDVFRLHKLALNTLGDLVAPVVIIPATTLANGSALAFPAAHEIQRPGLLEANGNIYVAFGSTGDSHPAISRGVVAGYNASTLAPLTSNLYTNRQYEVSNAYYMSSIWQSGYALAADSSGNIYFSTANSSPFAASYGPPYNYPDSALKLSGDLSTVLGSFTQYNYYSQDGVDGDFGAGGTLVVPDQNGIYPHLLVAGGKDGYAYILNRDNLGGYTSQGPNKDLAQLTSGPCWCGPAYFVGSDGTPRIVTAGANGVTSWKLTDGTTFGLTSEGSVSAANTDGQPDGGGTIPSISSNGKVAGTGILWFVQGWNNQSTYALDLQAYSVTNLATPLYTGAAGNWTNFDSNAFLVPTIANGYVYVGSYKQVQIYGLLAKSSSNRTSLGTHQR